MKHICNFDDYVNENKIGPIGWNWRNRFVDEEGTVYTKGIKTGKQNKRPDFEEELQRLYQELDKYHKKDPQYKTILSLIEDMKKGMDKVIRDVKR